MLSCGAHPGPPPQGHQQGKISWQAKLGLAKQILMHLPEMPQPREYGQHSTNPQLFISSSEETLLGKPKEKGLGTSCSLDLAPKQCHVRKNIFQAVTLAWKLAGGSLPSVLVSLQIRRFFHNLPLKHRVGEHIHLPGSALL